MKIILTQDVANLGAPGDIVEVKDGYGRNYLLPQGLAILATKGAEKQIGTIKRVRLNREIRGTEHAKEVAGALASLKVTLPARAGEGGKLFGSVTTADVVAAVKAAGGPSLDKRTVVLPGHIKALGAHKVSVKLHPGVEQEISFEVVAQ